MNASVITRAAGKLCARTEMKHFLQARIDILGAFSFIKWNITGKKNTWTIWATRIKMTKNQYLLLKSKYIQRITPIWTLSKGNYKSFYILKWFVGYIDLYGFCCCYYNELSTTICFFIFLFLDLYFALCTYIVKRKPFLLNSFHCKTWSAWQSFLFKCRPILCQYVLFSFFVIIFGLFIRDDNIGSNQTKRKGEERGRIKRK